MTRAVAVGTLEQVDGGRRPPDYAGYVRRMIYERDDVAVMVYMAPTPRSRAPEPVEMVQWLVRMGAAYAVDALRDALVHELPVAVWAHEGHAGVAGRIEIGI
jgi:hypothetical protein